MQINSVTRYGRKFAIVAHLMLCLTISAAVIPVTTVAVFAGKDDEKKKKKSSVFKKIFSRRSAPAAEDKPESASSSSATSSRPRQVSRTDRSSNLVPVTAEEEIDDRERRILAETLDSTNREIEGNYKLEYKEILDQFSDVSNFGRRYGVGDAPVADDNFRMDSDTLDLLLKAGERQSEAEGKNTGSNEQRKLFEDNQRLISRGFVVVPNNEQFVALSKLSEQPKSEKQPFNSLDVDEQASIKQYLARNALMVKDAKRNILVEATTARIDQDERVAAGEKSFGGNGAYDVPPEPEKYRGDDNDDDDASADTSRKEKK